MTRKRLAPCAEPGCPTLTMETYCPECRRKRAAKGDQERGYHSGGHRWVYRSKRWKAARRRQLASEPWCQWEDGCTLIATDVDHIVRMEDGGAPFDPANLQSLCHSHHSRKTAGEVWHPRAESE